MALTEEALEIANRQQRNRLKQILLAFRDYEAEHGRLPAAAICDKDGKPLLSWRVALLAKLGHKDLLAEFHRNEPWDSAHNKQLLGRMPAVYAPLQPDPKRPHTTCWQVFTGKGTLFEGTEGMRLKDVKNDKAILCVEGAEPVPWTRPDDLAYGAKKPLAKLGGHYPTGLFIGTNGSGCGRAARKSLARCGSRSWAEFERRLLTGGSDPIESAPVATPRCCQHRPRKRVHRGSAP